MHLIELSSLCEEQMRSSANISSKPVVINEGVDRLRLSMGLLESTIHSLRISIETIIDLPRRIFIEEFRSHLVIKYIVMPSKMKLVL